MTGIYARQSVDKKDSISIEGQTDLCKKEAQNEEIKVYTDKGFSGANMNRPSFKQLISDIEKGEIDKVVVYRLDRISRSLLDFAGMIDTFKKHSVTFISCSEKFDTSTPIGNAMLSIIMVFAQLERETIQQRIRDNYYQRGKKGMYLGGPPPYGFNKEKTQYKNISTSILTANSDIDNVKTIYELYNSGYSLGMIAKELNERKIPSPSGKNWSSLAVSRTLKNPVYVKADADVYMYYKLKGCIITNELSDFIGENGCYLYGKRDRNVGKYTDVSGHTLSIAPHPGVIDSEEWIKAQKKLSQNVQIKNTGKSLHSWLSGVVKCRKCGYTMTVVNYNSQKYHYKYFTCRGKTNYNICEGSKSIQVSVVEAYVEEAIKEKAKGLNFLDNREKKVSDSQDKIKVIQIEEQIENLLKYLSTASDVTFEYINKKITDLHAEKEELMKSSLNNADNINTELEKVKKDIQHWDELSFEEKKINAKALISKVLLEDGTIEIKWKY